MVPELSGVVLEAFAGPGAGSTSAHGLGRAATLTMGELAGISEGERVLDIGAGIGGPARTLAAHRGARVTALDPTRRFCNLNEELCRHSRLDENVEIACRDARRMSIDDGEFDVVWTHAV